MLSEVPDLTAAVADWQWLKMVLGCVGWGIIVGLIVSWLTNRGVTASEDGA